MREAVWRGFDPTSKVLSLGRKGPRKALMGSREHREQVGKEAVEQKKIEGPLSLISNNLLNIASRYLLLLFQGYYFEQIFLNFHTLKIFKQFCNFHYINPNSVGDK